MAQWIKCLLCKHEDQSSDPSSCTKMHPGLWCTLMIPALGGSHRNSSWVFWPASKPNYWTYGWVRDLVSENKVKSDTPMCTHTHIWRHTWTCVSAQRHTNSKSRKNNKRQQMLVRVWEKGNIKLVQSEGNQIKTQNQQKTELPYDPAMSVLGIAWFESVLACLCILKQYSQ